ncbi:acetyl-CoA C-acyltransferase [Halobellus sp. GM3]|uniref:acetyl-CoA C-acyltransferase n=1 Tax=Halobellus sp. GM3 TaxID=3458410 RepID=UPI00403DAB9A
MNTNATPVIAAAVRTPQGKEDGVFRDMRSEDLSIPLINELIKRTGIDPASVDDLLWGCAQQRGEQDNNLARVIALLSEVGEETPAATINRWCASSMQAVMSAADAIGAGQRECIIAGGVESMTRTPIDRSGKLHPRLDDRYSVENLEMGTTAETVANRYEISREAQDDYALRSHQRAADATDGNRFADEIVPIETTGGVFDEDEGIRRDTSKAALGELPTVFEESGTVTPGNASQISDGAAALLITSKEFAKRRDLDILAEVGHHEVAGVNPEVMGIGPVPATKALLERTDRTIEEFGLIELNEAFASQTLYCKRELNIEDEVLNVNGGAIALGHPLGASGARLPVSLVHEMAKRNVKRGLATMCVGFGQGAAITFERKA